MKFRVLAFALAAFAAAGCSNNPGITPPGSGLNPSSVLVTVTVGGAPAPGITVTLSTALNGALPAGSTLATQVTNDKGQATFGDLPPTGQLCLSATQSSPNYAAAVGACHAQPIPSKATLAFTK